MQLARIVIGFDGGALPGEALRFAARLATETRASLSGVFIEDETLLSLAGFSFVREVCVSGHVGAFNAEDTLRVMRGHAATARRLLENIAGDAHLDWSFEVSRGRSLQTLASIVRTGDLIIIRSSSLAPASGGRSGMIMLVPGEVEAHTVAIAATNAGISLSVVNAASLGDDHPEARLALLAGCPVLVVGGGPASSWREIAK